MTLSPQFMPPPSVRLISPLNRLGEVKAPPKAIDCSSGWSIGLLKSSKSCFPVVTSWVSFALARGESSGTVRSARGRCCR
jgi:hypothetical protein